MAFTKAEPEQAALKVSIYGPPGSGKTFTTLLVAEGIAQRENKRVAFVDTERGTDFYARPVKQRRVHPEAFDFDAIYTTSLAKVVEEVHALDPAVYGTVVIDSISHLWDAAINAYDGKMVGPKEDKIPMHAWGAIKKPYKDLIRFLMDSPFHVFILGRQKNVFEDDGEGGISKTGVAMKAEGETPYEPHICCRMEARFSDASQTVGGAYLIAEKDRTGVLQGRTIANPSFETFEPILDLMGAKQAQSENPDEVALDDAQLIRENEAKKERAGDKSAGLLTTYSGRVQAATDMETLAGIAAELKKQKRYLTEGHYESLRAIYDAKRQDLTKRLAPQEV